MSRTLAEGCEVRLEEPVRAIRQVNDSVVVATDRDTYRADHVVVAVPAPIVTELGFDPPLPEWKVRALTNLQLGSGGKVIARVRRRGSPEGAAGPRVRHQRLTGPDLGDLDAPGGRTGRGRRPRRR